jgi:hypothetical protein
MANKNIITYTDVYDQEKSSDYQYGKPDSTNLNPKREIDIKQRDLFNEIEARIQRVTDDLIQEQLKKKPKPGLSINRAVELAAKAEALAKSKRSN